MTRSQFSFTSLTSLAVSALLIGCSIYLLYSKALYSLEGSKYIQYGYDAARVIDYTRDLLAYGRSNPTNRLGLPILAAVTTSLANLPTTQTLLGPFLIIRVGSAFIIFLLANKLSNLRSATLATVIFALVFDYAPIASSYLAAYVLVPIKLFLLASILSLSPPSHRKLFITLSIISFTSIYLAFTYPIHATLLDALTVIVVLVALFASRINSTNAAIIISGQLLSSLLYFLFFESTWAWQLPPSQVIYRAYTAHAISISPSLLFLLYLGFHLFQFVTLLILLAPTSSTLSFSIVKLKLLAQQVSSKLDQLHRLSVAFFIFGSASLLSRWHHLFSNNPSQFTHSSLRSWLQSILFWLSITVITHAPYWKHSSLMLKTLTIITSIYLFIFFLRPSFLSSIVNNERIYIFFLPLIVTIVAAGLARFKPTPAFLCLLALATTTFTFSLHSTRILTKRPGTTSIHSAMNWFVTQEDHESNVVYAHYFAIANLIPHELPYASYFTASIVPNPIQKQLAKCDYNYSDCVSLYRSFINQNHIKYLIIESATPDIQQDFLSLGELIYDTSPVKIIRFQH